MTDKHELEKEKGAYLRDIRFVTDNFNVYEVAEEMDQVEGENNKQQDR
ncbi:hypothetical protein [Lihuaxuella thermophila]|uniref:Uncharacterized protein n=1 Tax=Lihuaxuella thermophila TaxID=1173111 RepID=A0A1H8FRY3_9BACL|nr:hypothetical protein [Lihuaxuella thermophila]SEN34452.1 hypothetical protein SAMN05444955_10938 [Lihuaxuella thermophila]